MPKKRATTKPNPTRKGADCGVNLGPQGRAQYQLLVAVLRERGTFVEETDRVAVGLATVALVAVQTDQSIERLAEARAWLSELGLTPMSRMRSTLMTAQAPRILTRAGAR